MRTGEVSSTSVWNCQTISDVREKQILTNNGRAILSFQSKSPRYLIAESPTGEPCDESAACFKFRQEGKLTW